MHSAYYVFKCEETLAFSSVFLCGRILDEIVHPTGLLFIDILVSCQSSQPIALENGKFMRWWKSYKDVKKYFVLQPWVKAGLGGYHFRNN